MFGELLKKARKSKRLSQDDFAKAMNVSGSTISMWESGDREPGFETLIKIADYFGYSTDYFLGRVKGPYQVKLPEEFDMLGIKYVEGKKKVPSPDAISELEQMLLEAHKKLDVLKRDANPE